MKIKLYLLTAISLLCLSMSQGNAASAVFGSTFTDTDSTYSTNSEWGDEGMTFELGVFGGFTPDSNNVDLWEQNWSITIGGSTQWVDDGGDFGFSGSGEWINNDSPFENGSLLYVWGFTNRGVGTHEWILFSNSSWTVVNAS